VIKDCLVVISKKKKNKMNEVPFSKEGKICINQKGYFEIV